MSTTSPSNRALATLLELNHSADYTEFVDAQFMALVLREGLPRLRGLSWPSEFSNSDSLGDVVSAISYDYSGSRCVVARLPSAVAMLITTGSVFTARLAANTEAALDEAERLLRETVPQTRPNPARQEAVFAFWRFDAHAGGAVTLTKIPVSTWPEIAGNYSSRTADRLRSLMDGFRPGHGGRLLLWTGAPGTGKTYALRALAWEWRAWCSVHYITDPETLFGGGSQYLMHLLTRPTGPDRWRLLVLEDTGELLSADAKSRTGQGLSRLLNVTDGLIGQGFPTLVLVTTNEETRTLHPAIARPGRCAAHVDFGALNEDEASAWLGSRGLDGREPGARTLAELYAIADDFVAPESTRQSIGFAA